MKSRTPRLAFDDFWHEPVQSELERNPLYRLLATHFDVVHDQERPEFLIYSCFGQNHYRYTQCPKIFFIGENLFPNFNECDWAFSFDATEGRNIRLPLWTIQMGESPLELLQPTSDPEQVLARKSRFCAFVYSNPECEVRNRFFRILSGRKQVDAAGKLFNNTEGLSGRTAASAFHDLPAFYGRYKFVIAFENNSAPNYTTEKIVAPLLGGSVPIYWGNPDIAKEFDPRSFINAHDFDSLEALADHVVKVDTDDSLYLEYLTAPRFPNGKFPEDADWSNIASHFKTVFGTRIEPVAQQSFSKRLVLPHLPSFVLKQIRKRQRKRLRRPPERMRNPTLPAVKGAKEVR